MAVLRRLAGKQLGERVVARGWIESVRRLKKVAFVDVTDGSQPLPMSAVITPEDAVGLSTGASVEISGRLAQGPKDVELQADSVRVIGQAGPDYPLQKKYHSREFLRQLPQFRWKAREAAQVLRYRSWALGELRNFFDSRDVIQVNSPILTSSDCEGAGEVFELAGSREFFGKPVYQTVSSQLHLEVFSAALNRVWNFTPAFRAEASDTNRHLSEFWLVEAELSFVDKLPDLIKFCEDMTQSCIPSGNIAEDLLASKRDPETCAALQKRWRTLEQDWTSMSYTEALSELNKAAEKGNVSHALEWGQGIPSEHEKFLSGAIVGGPTVVTDYPAQVKPFYMKDSSRETGSTDDTIGPGGTVACFDVLIPEIGEVVGGSLREDNYDKLCAKMQAAGMDTASLQWYLDLRKFGSVPHGGYGLGFERLVMYACGLSNIRDAIGFVRGAGQCLC